MSDYSMQDGEKRVPLSVVLITIGVIILITAVIIWRILILPRAVAQAIPTVVPVANGATLSETAVTNSASSNDGQITLLPETPQDPEQYPAHFVSALEAAVPNVGQPTRIEIPTINLNANITAVGLQAFEGNGQPYYQWQVPDESRAGWHNSSAKLGDRGNTVINGHHNILGEVFRDLIELNEGDQIILHDPAGAYTYQISDILILEERDQPLEVRQENAEWISQTDDERITLITCWPYTDNTHRVVVVAHPIPNDS